MNAVLSVESKYVNFLIDLHFGWKISRTNLIIKFQALDTSCGNNKCC